MTKVQELFRYILSLFGIEKTYNFDIELCSPCNAKCTFCPQSTDGVKRSQSVMTKEQILTLVSQLDELSQNAKIGIFFCGMGENLIRKDLLLLFIKSIKNLKKYSFTLVTNGHLLTEEFITNPLLENLKIEISMSGWESYESIYKLPAEKVRNKIIETAKLIGSRLKILKNIIVSVILVNCTLEVEPMNTPDGIKTAPENLKNVQYLVTYILYLVTGICYLVVMMWSLKI